MIKLEEIIDALEFNNDSYEKGAYFNKAENYTGFKIFGDYNDLEFLYDSIHYLIKGEPETMVMGVK